VFVCGKVKVFHDMNGCQRLFKPFYFFRNKFIHLAPEQRVICQHIVPRDDPPLCKVGQEPEGA
jgi:hypothetical protein